MLHSQRLCAAPVNVVPAPPPLTRDPNRAARWWHAPAPLRVLALCGLVVALGGSVPHAAAAVPVPAEFIEGEALVIFKAGTNEAAAATATARHPLTVVRKFAEISRQHQRVHCHLRSASQSTAELIAELQLDPDVELAEPNYLRHLSSMTVPNDANFTNLWALHNTGQTVNGGTGTAGVDIGFLDAWGMAKPSSTQIVVAVIDSGLDLTHPDLLANVWTNPGEIAGDGVDNDGNGYVDDIHGYDFVSNDMDATDSGLHGTHVSGIIAAVANNSVGVAGTAFQARLMPLKVSIDGSTIDTASTIAALDYVVMMKGRGVNIVAINASYGGGNSSTVESNAIQAAGNAGIVFCTAAGNDATDNTKIPTYPANYRLANMIVVAASDASDKLASFSDYGSKVDLAAPGTNIFSTTPTWLGTITSTLTRAATSYSAAPLTYSGFTAALGGTIYHCGLGNPGDFPAAVKGNIALIQRGTLTFAAKVTNAMRAGAKAVIVYNNASGSINGTLATGIPTATAGNWIPALAISQTDGQTLEAALPTTVTLANVASPATIYGYEDGTSMATPYVTAALAFAARNFPAETAVQRIARIVNHVTPVVALSGKVASGGRLNLTRSVDTDANGLPDWWELAYLGTIGNNPAADLDGDGFPNLEEYLIGTLPNVANPLAIYKTEIVQNGANRDFRISFPTAVRVTYRVEWNESLTAGSWVQLGSDVIGTGSPATATDAGAVTLHPKRFYRVRSL